MTASTKAHKIKQLKKISAQTLAVQFLTKKPFSTASCKYGLEKEKVALAAYEQLYKVKVQTMRFFVKPLQPWLGVSIDGVVVEDGSPIKLLEVKCPISCKSYVSDVKKRLTRTTGNTRCKQTKYRDPENSEQ
ncbi:hypothetical protein PV326_008797 [Microctonus aethiopoides]|nr:hypothetical protein PV326_008797 [Microctonus aethiopoides]